MNFTDIMTLRSEETTINSTGTSEVPFSVAVDVILMISVAITALFGLVANFITFLVIATSDKLKSNAFNIMIMSLCVSDFVSSAISPLSYYGSVRHFFSYHLPVFVCKIDVTLVHWTTLVTVHHILAFTILRIAALKLPHSMKKFTPFRAKILVVLLWILTFGLYAWLPLVAWDVLMLTRGQKTMSMCLVKNSWQVIGRNYLIYGYPFFYFLPILSVVFLTVYLIFLVRKRRNRREKSSTVRGRSDITKKENFAIIQLSLIIASYLVGYLPDIAHTGLVIVTFFLKSANLSPSGWTTFTTIRMLFLRISECMNPVAYNLASSTMRKATMEFLRGVACRRQPASTAAGSSSDNIRKDNKEQLTTTTKVLPGLRFEKSC